MGDIRHIHIHLKYTYTSGFAWGCIQFTSKFSIVVPATDWTGKGPDEGGDNRHCQDAWPRLETIPMNYDSFRVVETTRRTYRHADVQEIHRDAVELKVATDQAPESLQDQAWQTYVTMHDGNGEDMRPKDEVLSECQTTVVVPWNTIEAMWP